MVDEEFVDCVVDEWYEGWCDVCDEEEKVGYDVDVVVVGNEIVVVLLVLVDL